MLGIFRGHVNDEVEELLRSEIYIQMFPDIRLGDKCDRAWDYYVNFWRRVKPTSCDEQYYVELTEFCWEITKNLLDAFGDEYRRARKVQVW